MLKKKPTILITNDDDITAPGIRALVNAVKHIGKVVVVAPNKPQSGMGHAITIGEPLRMRKSKLFDDVGVESWETSGTPADCVKLAVDKILKKKPDLCLSGINHGANYSINVIYSGTMSAAMEASIEGIPSIGFSAVNYSYEADMGPAQQIAAYMVEQLLQQKKLDSHFLLNVNIPSVPAKQIKGIKICKQAHAKYEEDYQERIDPMHKKYYWLTGKFINFDTSRDSDVKAIENNYVSVVPVSIDLTNYKLKEKLTKNNIFNTWKAAK